MHDVLSTKTRPLEVLGESEITLPDEDANDTLRKWRIKTDKTMFPLKTTVEEEMLEHI